MQTTAPFGMLCEAQRGMCLPWDFGLCADVENLLARRLDRRRPFAWYPRLWQRLQYRREQQAHYLRGLSPDLTACLVRACGLHSGRLGLPPLAQPPAIAPAEAPAPPMEHEAEGVPEVVRPTAARPEPAAPIAGLPLSPLPVVGSK